MRDPGRILALAERMGLVDAGAEPDANAARRLAALMAAGALSPGTVAELERELGPSVTPEPDLPIDFRYQPVRVLGEGGMGRVYLARDRDLGRDVALKVLRPGRAADNDRVLDEACAQAQIDHPHVCQIYGVGEVDGRAYLSLQLARGGTLAEAAARLDAAAKTRLLADAAEGVHAAHERGLIHRDLKPGNILLEGERAVVSDFGIACAAQGSGGRAGTPGYMAPEQVRGEPVDRRTDVYGLGATLVAVFAGRPTASVDQLPPRVAAIAARCLDPDPARRFPTARSLAQALRGLERRRWRGRALVFPAALAVVAAVVALAWPRAGDDGVRVAEEVARLEALVRVVHGAPLHDLRVEHAAIRTRLAALGRRAPTAATERALGLGALALGEVAEARAHLERAWGLGAPDVATARALGAVLVEERLRALLAGRAPPPVRAPEDADPLVVAQRAFLDGRYGEAATRAEDAAVEPTRREALALVAAARLAEALATRAPDALARARDAYAVALAAAPSDPRLLDGDCARARLSAEPDEACRRAALASGDAP